MRCGCLQEVPNIVWLVNFWYFGKLVTEESWLQPEVGLYAQFMESCWYFFVQCLYINKKENKLKEMEVLKYTYRFWNTFRKTVMDRTTVLICVFPQIANTSDVSTFGECPIYLSALQKSQDVFRSILITHSPFNHIDYNSRNVCNSTWSYSCISYGHSLVTQEFPVIVNSYQLVQFTSMWNCHTLFVMQHDNTFPTHTPLIWFAIEAYVIILF